MEHSTPYFSRSSHGSVDQKLDLTLRLGLPFHDSQVQDSNGKEIQTDSIVQSKNVSLNNGSKTCKDCGIDETPMWRKGPTGPQTLCNACGLRYARLIKKEKEQIYFNQYYFNIK